MVKVIVYTVCFAIVVGLCYYGYYAIDSRGYTRGFNVADAMWKTKATEALGKRIDGLEELADVIEERALFYKADVAKLDKDYAEELEYVELGKDMAIAAVLDGVVKLYDPFNPKRAGRGSHCEGEVETAGITVCTRFDNDSEGGELHPKTSAFLFGETLRADGYTEQLGKCQDQVEILERQCGAQDANSTN